jgi:hypothetical protein
MSKMQAIDPDERNNIMKLKGELNDSKLDHKVEWLYTGDKIDRDAYLLGKPIDKLLIEKELVEKPKENIFANTVDLANKIREDPLFEIKKQEIEAKRRLLANPIKINQIREQILRSENTNAANSSKKRDPSSNSDSDSSSHRKHRRKHKSKISSKKHKRHHKSESSGEESDDYESKSKHHKKRSSPTRKRSRSPQKGGKDERLSRPSPINYASSSGKYGLIKKEEDKPISHDRSKSTDNSKKSQSQLEIEEYKRKIDKLEQIKKKKYGCDGDARRNKDIRVKLSEEEKQKRLAEMQDNAKWREDVRNKNLKTYKREDRHDEDLQESNNSKHYQKEATHNFNNLMRDAYSSTEDRIKRNIKNIQRNSSALDSNFARK